MFIISAQKVFLSDTPPLFDFLCIIKVQEKIFCFLAGFFIFFDKLLLF